MYMYIAIYLSQWYFHKEDKVYLLSVPFRQFHKKYTIVHQPTEFLSLFEEKPDNQSVCSRYSIIHTLPPPRILVIEIPTTFNMHFVFQTCTSKSVHINDCFLHLLCYVVLLFHVYIHM